MFIAIICISVLRRIPFHSQDTALVSSFDFRILDEPQGSGIAGAIEEFFMSEPILNQSINFFGGEMHLSAVWPA